MIGDPHPKGQLSSTININCIINIFSTELQQYSSRLTAAHSHIFRRSGTVPMSGLWRHHSAFQRLIRLQDLSLNPNFGTGVCLIQAIHTSPWPTAAVTAADGADEASRQATDGLISIDPNHRYASHYVLIGYWSIFQPLVNSI